MRSSQARLASLLAAIAVATGCRGSNMGELDGAQLMQESADAGDMGDAAVLHQLCMNLLPTNPAQPVTVTTELLHDSVVGAPGMSDGTGTVLLQLLVVAHAR